MDQTKNSTLNSNFNKHIFRDYDIRGIPNKDFQPEFANQLATAIHKFFPEGKIVLSRDLRKSGIFLLENMQNTFSSLGREVINIGENPTPILYYATCKEQATGSIQITASHKGKEWNGFKINGTQANPIDAETGIYKIKDLIIKGCSIEGVEGANLPKHHIFERASKSDLSEAKLRSSNCGPAPNERSETFNTAKEITGTVETKNYQQQYINEITNNISINQNKKLNVVIDTGNGSVGNILRTILENKNIKVIAINEQINDEFPNHPADPLKDENLKQLQAAVIEHNADFGLALDGDGDRCGIIDNEGEIASRDKTLMLLTKDALEKKQGPVVTEVRASLAYLDYIKENGGEPIMTKAGHSFILREVKKQQAVFGGELTGHMYFPLDFYDFDDGIFTGVKLTQIISNLNEDLNTYLTSLPEYLASKEYHLNASDETKFQKIQAIKEQVEKEGQEFLGIDGVRINYQNKGWLLIRASNTGPKIKCRFEAKTEENFNFLKKELERLLNMVDLGLF